MEADQLNIASGKRRVAAYMIDHVTITVILVGTVFLTLGTDFLDNNSISKLFTVLFGVMGPGFFLYFAKDSIKGISFGRWVMGIMVRDEKEPEKAPSFGHLLLRNLFLIIWPIELIKLASSPEKKRLGDNYAKTIVVRNPNKPSKFLRILPLVAVAIISLTSLVIFVGSAMKSSEAYKTAVEQIEQNEQILNETEGIKGYGMMPAGSVNIENGYGQAQLQITVLGNERDVEVSVYLTKEPNGGWQVQEINQ